MVRMIEKKSAMKAYFYFMFLDEQFDDGKNNRLDEIGAALSPGDYDTIKDDVVAECNELIKGIDDESETYDVIQIAIDELLNNVVKHGGIGSRLLMWTFIAIAKADDDHCENENSMIKHIARILQIDKSVVLEMKYLVATIKRLEHERELLEDSTKSYREVRPQVIEVEKRLAVLIQASKELILDEDLFLNTKFEEHTENGGIMYKVGKAIVEGLGIVYAGVAASIMAIIGGLFGTKI